MNDLNKYGKPSFEPDEKYWSNLEDRLLAIPAEEKNEPIVRSIKRYRWWAAAAVILLGLSIVPFVQNEQNNTLTYEEIALYIENDGAWMMDDLAFYEEVRSVEFIDEEESGDDDYELLYLEGVDDVESYWNIDS